MSKSHRFEKSTLLIKQRVTDKEIDCKKKQKSKIVEIRGRLAERHGVPRRHGDVRSAPIGGYISAVTVDSGVG